MASPANIVALPPEVLAIIFKQLCTIKDIISCKKVCTNWRNVIDTVFKDKGKFLLVSQKGHEILNLINPSAKYELFVDNVPRVKGATGGLLQKSPIVCGGNFNNEQGVMTGKDCIVIGQPELKMKMLEKRRDPASIVLDQRMLWIVGGYTDKDFLGANESAPSDFNCTTEFIKLGQPTVKGPDLPFIFSEHSMIQYDKKSIYIIGGQQNLSSSNKTWIVDPTNDFKIREGPSLNVGMGRYGHSCAKMTLNNRIIIVVAGGLSNSEILDSVEILDPTRNNNWTEGPNLPMKLMGIKMVTSPTGKGVIVIGGKTNRRKESKVLFELSESLEWITLEQTLQKCHDFVTPIPDELVYEKVQVKRNKNKRIKLSAK